jgi:hypothetical protein
MLTPGTNKGLLHFAGIAIAVDLSAHFYLSLVYAQLGMKKEAAQEGALYAEHKDDPGAALLALDFRYRNPLVTHENEPYHLHSSPSRPPEEHAGKK